MPLREESAAEMAGRDLRKVPLTPTERASTTFPEKPLVGFLCVSERGVPADKVVTVGAGVEEMKHKEGTARSSCCFQSGE